MYKVMYKVIKKFRDSQDGLYAYSVGDKFPHNGVEVDAERIAELASDKNRLGVPLIVEVKPKRTNKKRTNKTFTDDTFTNETEE